MDHYAFNDATVANRALHRKVTLISQASVPSASATAGILFSQSNPDTNVNRIDPYYLFDSGGIGSALQSPVIPIKAFGCFRMDQSGTITIFQGYNVTSVTRTSGTSNPGTYVVVFTNKINNSSPNSGINYPVILSISTGNAAPTALLQASYSNTQNSQFTINTTGIPSATFISFLVLQV